MTARALLSPADCRIAPHPVAGRTAAITLDLEADFGGDCFHAHDGLDTLVERLAQEGIALTVFAEGRLFERFPQRMAALARRVELQLHCHDHRQDGDTPATLRRSVEVYREVLGRPPQGYRAHTYRLDGALMHALVDQGFRWDASVLPLRFGHGANPHPVWRQGALQCFVLDDGALVAFPVAVLRRLPLPFVHSYQVLARPAAARVATWLGGLPGLCVYDMHMVDLFRVPCIGQSALPRTFKALYRASWWGRGADTLAQLVGNVRLLRRAGYRFVTLAELHAEVREAL